MYLEQSEGRHPAGPALLLLCTQHLQLLTLAPHFAGLSNSHRGANDMDGQGTRDADAAA